MMDPNAPKPRPLFESDGGDLGTRLLLISYHFTPDRSVGALRWEKFAPLVAERGWGLDVISAGPTELDGPARRRLDALPPGVRVFGVPTTPLAVERFENWFAGLYRSVVPRRESSKHLEIDASSVSFSRSEILSLRWSARHSYRLYSAWLEYARGERWARRAATCALQVIEPAVHRVVIGCGPPESAYRSARLVSLRSGLPLVVDMRDPWSLKERLEVSVATPLWYRLGSALEKLVVSQSELIIMNTEPARTAMAAEYRYPEERILAVLNGFEPRKRRRDRMVGRFRAVYAGSVYLDRDPTPLFAAARRVVDRLDLAPEDFELVFVGSVSRNHPALSHVARRAGMERYLTTLDPMPREETFALMSTANVLLSLPQDSDLAIPAKIFDYLQFQAAILALSVPGSATARLLAGSGADVVEAEDIDGIAAVFERHYRAHTRGETPTPISVDPRYSTDTQGRRMLDRIAGVWTEEREPAFPRRGRHTAASWNWRWLTANASPRSILVVTTGSERGEESSQVREQLRRLLAANPDGGQPRIEVHRADPSESSLPFGVAEFECVVVLDNLESLGPPGEWTERVRPLLAECQRVLRWGGCLWLGGRNPLWYRDMLGRAERKRKTVERRFALVSLLGSMGLDLAARILARRDPRLGLDPLRATVRELERAGFRDVRGYYADPDARHPDMLIPGRAAHAVARDRLAGSRRVLQHLLLHWGGYRLLFRSLMVVAEA